MNLYKYLKKQNFHSILLKKTQTNHFTLTVKINGVKGIFILDTGASSTCIGLCKVDKFAIEPEETETKASGAGTLEIDTKIATDVSIQIGKWMSHSSHIVLIDLSHVNTALEMHGLKPVDGIIGADVLERGKAIIDYKEKRLFLKKKAFGYKFLYS